MKSVGVAAKALVENVRSQFQASYHSVAALCCASFLIASPFVANTLLSLHLCYSMYSSIRGTEAFVFLVNAFVSAQHCAWD